MSKTKKLGLPKAITLQITEGCNLRCKMCYYWGETGAYSKAEPGRKPAVMELDLVKRIVKELSLAKPFYSLFGGEPLTHPKIEEIIRVIKEAGSPLDTPTNGTLLEKYASMLVQTGFDSVRVSIDGPKEINDAQRGKGSFNKAMAGIEALHREKEKADSKTPYIGLLYTITPFNYLSTEEFFLNDVNLSAIQSISFQMEDFITEEMGNEYAKFLKDEFGIENDMYWKGITRSIEYFKDMDTNDLARQIQNVKAHLKNNKINSIMLPPTYSPENLRAYLNAEWNDMTDLYKTCMVPWLGADITASGDVAPCHVFYDFILGNLYENSISEIWYGEKFQKYREIIKKNNFLSICPGCCILYLFGVKKRKAKNVIN